MFADPRTPHNGLRLLCPPSVVKGVGQSDLDDYRLMRLINGIIEGGDELSGQLPLNTNLHTLNGISFTKGCYIGQELTQRTFHSGVIRKMALPFAISETSLLSDNCDP